MDSPSMGNMTAGERMEERNRWQGYEVQQMHNNKYRSYSGGSCYSEHSGSYSDWGNASYSESRRRPMQPKYNRNSRRHHQQQQAWNADRAPAPASPQWQPQPPPPPPPPPVEPSFNRYQQDMQGAQPVAVNLQGLPPTLCRQPFLEAMLDQAGLANDITGCVLGEDQDTGKAVIYLANYNSAVKCVQHFSGRRWDQAGQPVTASIEQMGPISQGTPPPPVNVPSPMPATRGPANHGPVARPNPCGGQNGQEPTTMIAAPLPFVAAGSPGPWMMLQPVLPPFNHQGSETSPKAGSNGSNSPKIHWADITDETEKERENDLSEGQEGSTTSGSNSRADEGFFFGCDVDTDDGF